MVERYAIYNAIVTAQVRAFWENPLSNNARQIFKLQHGMQTYQKSSKCIEKVW